MWSYFPALFGSMCLTTVRVRSSGAWLTLAGSRGTATWCTAPCLTEPPPSCSRAPHSTPTQVGTRSVGNETHSLTTVLMLLGLHNSVWGNFVDLKGFICFVIIKSTTYVCLCVCVCVCVCVWVCVCVCALSVFKYCYHSVMFMQKLSYLKQKCIIHVPVGKCKHQH